MTDRINGGSPAVHPQQYHTVPTAVIQGAEGRDRYLNNSEAKTLLAFLNTGQQRLQVAGVLAQHADEIIAAGAKRIFVGGNPMEYLELPTDPVGLPGSEYFVAEDYLSPKARTRQSNVSNGISNSLNRMTSTPLSSPMDWFKGLFFSGKPSVPSQFRAINITEYGSVRMKRSMRDLDWFLRYITYAIVAGDTSIISVNTKGLRGVIPEDVTLATTVSLREMQWKSLSYFPAESAAAALVKQYFNVLIADYQIEKPSDLRRNGVSKHDQGLSLPASYEDSASAQPRWVMKETLPDIEKEAVIKAAYRQVFERDIGQIYDSELSALVSQVKDGRGTMELFIRQLGKSRFYRQLYYEPYTLSRAIELACRHFLGRGLSCIEEFQQYFEQVAKQGFPALIDTLVGSQEYSDYFGAETVPYMRGLGLEAQSCRNWGPQLDLFKYSAPVRKVPQFVTTFAGYQQPLPNQHPYGVGNDPLEIQFGAIFPQETRVPKPQPAHFSEDSRRILISTWPQHSAFSGIKHDQRSVEHRIGSPSTAQKKTSYHSIDSVQQSVDAVILAAYRQVFGCEVLDSQSHPKAETQLRGQLITVREFVRQLAKTRTFRRAYWESLYVTKATEVIHRRLMGRPTYGRRETNKYYDICGRKGFYALVDALIDSPEYLETFGEKTVPYERYVTPRGLALRWPTGPSAGPNLRENPPIVGDHMMRYQPAKHPAKNSAPASGLKLANNKNGYSLLPQQHSEELPTPSPEESRQPPSQASPEEEIKEDSVSQTASEPVEVTA